MSAGGSTSAVTQMNDMDEEMRKFALDTAANALETNHEDSGISKHIKSIFDNKVIQFSTIIE